MNLQDRLEIFFFHRVSATGFGLLRIGWALTVCAFLLMQWNDVPDYYSSAGILPDQLESLISRHVWRFTLLDYVTSPSAVFLLYVVLLTLLLFCAAGLFTRVTTVASVLLLFSFHERNILLLAGGDTVLRNIGFLLAIAPCISAFSLDRRYTKWHQRRPNHVLLRPSTMPAWPVRLLTWQLIVIYGTTLWWKLSGDTWWNGTAVAIPLYHPIFARFPPRVMSVILPFTPFFTFATLLFEAAWLLLLIPSSLLPKPLRSFSLKRWLIAMGLFFHGSIFVLMDVGSFSVAMVASYCGLLTEEDCVTIGRWLTNLAGHLRHEGSD